MNVEVAVVESSDAFIRNEVVVDASLTVRGRRVRGAYVRVPRSLIGEPYLMLWLADRFEALLFPWRFPDRVVGWHIEPFPRLARIAARARRLLRR